MFRSFCNEFSLVSMQNYDSENSLNCQDTDENSMKNISTLTKKEKKQLLRRLLGIEGGQEIPRGALAALAAACGVDPSTAWHWPRDDGSWVQRKTEPKIWRYFGLSGQEAIEEVETILQTSATVLRVAKDEDPLLSEIGELLAPSAEPSKEIETRVRRAVARVMHSKGLTDLIINLVKKEEEELGAAFAELSRVLSIDLPKRYFHTAQDREMLPTEQEPEQYFAEQEEHVREVLANYLTDDSSITPERQDELVRNIVYGGFTKPRQLRILRRKSQPERRSNKRES